MGNLEEHCYPEINSTISFILSFFFSQLFFFSEGGVEAELLVSLAGTKASTKTRWPWISLSSPPTSGELGSGAQIKSKQYVPCLLKIS